MSDTDNEPLNPADEKLESELNRMMPSGLSNDFLESLVRQHAEVAGEEVVEGSAGSEGMATIERSRPAWILPLTLAAAVSIFCGMTYLRIQQSAGQQPVTESSTVQSAPSSRPEFVPVATDGFLMNASSGGIEDSEFGTRERIDLNFQDVDHWHDPETATHIRIISPRKETIYVPVQTD